MKQRVAQAFNQEEVMLNVTLENRKKLFKPHIRSALYRCELWTVGTAEEKEN